LSHLVVAIGEILWDVFPEGPKFGGAPANFACSAAELTPSINETVIVSAVGDDSLGNQAIEALRDRQVGTQYVQRNHEPTGRVDVKIDKQGVASYQFARNSAWDHLQWTDQLEQLAQQCDAVCFGSLGQRSIESRKVIQRFISTTRAQCLRIFDVNIRQPFIDDDCVISSLHLANVLKLNEDEFPAIASLYRLSGSPEKVLPELRKQLNLQLIAYTQGEKGSILVSDHGLDICSVPATDVVDTVGAGDAFTASLAIQMLRGQKLNQMNRHANDVAAYVCSKSGGTMAFPDELRIN